MAHSSSLLENINIQTKCMDIKAFSEKNICFLDLPGKGIE